MLDRFYKKFPGGAIQRNHIFWVDSSNPTVVYTKVSDGYEPEMIDLRCRTQVADGNREQELNSYILKQVSAPGLKEIKQVELYSKFRKFVPVEFRDEICPRPSEQVLQNIKKARSEKAKERTTRKRRAS